MFLYILFGMFLGIVLLDFYIRGGKDGKLFDQIHGPHCWPVIGNVLLFIVPQDKLFEVNRKLASTYQNIYRVWMGPSKVVNIYSPEDIEIILSNSKYNEKSVIYDYLKPWLGDGLLLSFGKKWHSRRKILTPAFHFNVLRQFSVILEENSWKLVEKLKQEAHKDKTEIINFITSFTLQCICETSMGTRLEDGNLDTIRSYKSAVYEMGELLAYRTTRPWLSPAWIFDRTAPGIRQKGLVKDLHEFTNKVIDERRAYFLVNEKATSRNEDDFRTKKLTAMLDVLLEAEKEGLIDRNGIREEVDTFMFEGHDTTASALCFTILMLANHQQAQEKVYQECVDVFGQCSDSQATMSELGELKYLECCIKEALRLFPSVPFISRHLKCDVQLNEFLVPAYTWCNVHIFDLHRRADLWPEPEAFKPERFTVENSAKRHPYAYVPFSAGPRNCIGQRFAMLELKSAVAAILRNYKLLPVTQPEDIVFMTDLVLRAKTPIYVQFQNRH